RKLLEQSRKDTLVNPQVLLRFIKGGLSNIITGILLLSTINFTASRNSFLNTSKGGCFLPSKDGKSG
ncbi:hypothetical protein, partial [Escherichia coli]|uniref:hypothetical protein n=1 Tax=Escherichia coli TaxID=562 RepID=UPI001A7EC6C1